MRISVKGRPVDVPCQVIDGRTVIIKGRILRIAGLFDDFLDSRGVDEPEYMIRELKKTGKADIFTFLSSFANSVEGKEGHERHQHYHMEHDYLAAIHVVSFEHWWKHKIKKQTRRKVKKAGEEGVKICVSPLDDHLIQGIVRILNETPVRQGKLFWHYGKDFTQVKEEISTYADRSIFLGAYYEEELIGFAKLINCGDFGRSNQLLSMVKHRDKPVTNALIAELVRTCERIRIPYLIYGVWSDGTFGYFKRSNGFSKLAIPRYYAPLSIRGEVALRTGLHRGIRELIPAPILSHFLKLRRVWYERNSSNRS